MPPWPRMNSSAMPSSSSVVMPGATAPIEHVEAVGQDGARRGDAADLGL